MAKKKGTNAKIAAPQEVQVLEAESVQPLANTKAPKRPPRKAKAPEPAADPVIDLDEDHEMPHAPKKKAKKAVKSTATSALTVASTPATRTGLRSNPDDTGPVIRTSLFGDPPKAKKKPVNTDAAPALLPESQEPKTGRQASRKPAISAKKPTLNSSSVDKVMPAPTMPNLKVCIPINLIVVLMHYRRPSNGVHPPMLCLRFPLS
jgi:hypothetical protein